MNPLLTPQAPQRTPKPQQPLKPATSKQREQDDGWVGMLPPLIGGVVGMAILVAMAVAQVGEAGGMSALASALIGEHSAWYLSRASAFVAYLLLWWSMILGLSITNRLARLWPGGPVATDLHEHASLLGLGFGVLHALALLGDSYISYTLPQVLVPFAGTYESLWVGVGQISIYLMALVTGTFYIRRWIGVKAWRLIHFLSFVVFGMALAHSLMSGTDSYTSWVFWMYVVTSVSVLGMTLYRIFLPKPTPKARVRQEHA